MREISIYRTEQELHDLYNFLVRSCKASSNTHDNDFFINQYTKKLQIHIPNAMRLGSPYFTVEARKFKRGAPRLDVEFFAKADAPSASHYYFIEQHGEKIVVKLRGDSDIDNEDDATYLLSRPFYLEVFARMKAERSKQ